MKNYNLAHEDVKVNKELEMKIFREVTVPPTINNLPTCLALVAQEEYGLPTKFIVNWKEYKKHFIDNPRFKNDPRVAKLLECKERIKMFEKENLSTDEIKNNLQNGYMLGMVGEVENSTTIQVQPESVLHYRLIYGYEKCNDDYEFYVFDPLSGKFKTRDLQKIISNRYGMWGIVVGSKSIPLIENIEEKYLPEVKKLINMFNSFYSRGVDRY